MKKLILSTTVLVLSSINLLSAKNEEPKLPLAKSENSGFMQVNKTIKDESAKKFVITLKQESSADCFITVAVQASLGLPANWGYCYGLYNAGF